jgi:hypothetical protein
MDENLFEGKFGCGPTIREPDFTNDMQYTMPVFRIS